MPSRMPSSRPPSTAVAVRGAHLYCTHHPCTLCTKMIINAGIEAIFFLEGYPDELAGCLLKEAGVQTVQLSPE